MGPKNRVFKKEYSKELIHIAENDLISARTLASNNEVRRETVLMMVQQCIEKTLKAVLCALGLPLPQTHDLLVIIDRLGTENAPPMSDALDDLTPFATIRRYEEGRFEILDSDLETAFDVAENVLKWARHNYILLGK